MIVEALVRQRERQAKERIELAEKWPDLGYVFTTPIGHRSIPELHPSGAGGLSQGRRPGGAAA